MLMTLMQSVNAVLLRQPLASTEARVEPARSCACGGRFLAFEVEP